MPAVDYDDLADEWWRADRPIAMLSWLARARAHLIPPAARPGAVLVDLGCGGGLLAPHVRQLGYRHLGIDLCGPALARAGQHGVLAVRGDVSRLPLANGCADVVSAGEILEHVADVPAVLAEACRVLRPGGTMVLDTINATALARLLAVTLAERVAGPRYHGLHDPSLLVRPEAVVAECARHGVGLTVQGIRPAIGSLLWWLVTRRGAVPIVATRSTAVLYQGWGVKA